MSSLVLELQQDVLNASMSVSALLRKALVVATKLNIQEFQKWIELELRGYSEITDMPPYRLLEGRIEALNPFHGWQPVVFPDTEDSEIAKAISMQILGNSISEVEEMIRNTDGSLGLRFNLEMDLERNLRKGMPHCPRLAVCVSNAAVYGIVEAVKNIILEWSLKLQQDGILGEGITFSQEEKQIAAKNDYGSFIQINISQSQMQNSSSESRSNTETFNNDLGGANIANFANKVQGNARQVASNFSQNVNQNVDEIIELITSLREMAQEFPEAQREEAMIHLDDLQEDITIPEKQKPQRIKTRIVALLTIAGIVAGATDFANNVLELSEKLEIPINISVPQMMQNLPTLSPHQPGNSPLSGQSPH